MKKEIMQRTVVVWFLAMVSCILWGSAFPCIKIGYRLFHIPSGDAASQIFFAGCRFFLAGVLVLLIAGTFGRKSVMLRKEEIPRALILSVFQTSLQYVFFYMGLAHTTGVKSSIINGAGSFFVILIAALIFHQEKLTGRKMAGCFLGFLGVALINLGGSGGMDMTFRWNGELFILISTVSAACSSALIKEFSRKSDPVLLSGWQFVFGGFFMMCLGKIMGGTLAFHGTSPLILLFYMACISAVAYSLWSVLLKYNNPSRVAVFGCMNPIFGVMLSAVLLKEKSQAFSLTGLTSLVLVCTGIYIVNKENPSKDALKGRTFV